MQGELLALLTALCFAIANVTVTRGAAKGAADNGVFLSLLLTAAISAVCWLVSGARSGFVETTAKGWLWLAAAGVFTSFIGRVFLFSSIQQLGAMRASALKRLNPLFAVILGVIVLHDAISGTMAAGMALIALSFVILARDAFQRDPAPRGGAFRRLMNLGYLYAPVSALGYAIGYLFRKMGLNETPDPFFGAMIGSLVGAGVYVLVALFHTGYRAAIRSTFTTFNKWLFLAGVMSSFGQITYFVALNHSTISRVALIASLEIFITMFLAAFVMKKSAEPMGKPLFFAALLGVAGTMLVILR
jgi:drug/metabolite transporter (DMT)-like permease